MSVHAILLHGMGRTPLSMHGLATRLGKSGIQPHTFAYCAAFEGFENCRTRLKSFIETNSGEGPFIVIGHSLGSVLLRAVLPELGRQPLACFFLAPLTKASRAAKILGGNFLYRIATGDMGQKLGDETFMASLPVPNVPTVIYAGTTGPRGRWLPFRHEENDGVLAVSETRLSTGRIERVKSLHTFIMNSPEVTKDMLSTVDDLQKSRMRH